MPTSCCAYGCKNRHVKGNDIQFFSFPFKDPDRLAAWIAAIRRKDWNPTKSSRICSEHFTPSDFLKRPGAYIKHIKPNAVPSIFKALPNHLQPEEKAVRKESNLCQDIKPDCEPRSTEPPYVYKRVEHVVLLPDVEEPSSDSKESLVPRLKHKIRMLQQKLRRKEKQIKKLSTLLSEMKKESDTHKLSSLPLNSIQLWLNTKYLTTQSWEDSSNKSDCEMSAIETQSPKRFILSSSKEKSMNKSSGRKKDSNKNLSTATEKKEIIDIGEGTLQFIADIMSNDKNENILNNDDEKSINNSNTLNHKNKENETISKRNENLRIQKDYCDDEVPTVNTDSILEDNTTKLREMHNNRSSMFELTSHLRHADGSKITKGYKMNKKKRMPEFSVISKNMNDSTFVFSNSRVHKRRKTVRSSKFKNIFPSLPTSRNCRHLFPASIANNMIKEQNVIKFANGQCMSTFLPIDIAVNITHEKEREHNNLTPLKKTLNDKQQRKILNNGKGELKTVSLENQLTQSSDSSPITTKAIMSHGSFNPVTCLQRLCNIQEIANPNKTEACLRDMNAVVCLERLSESDIQKYKSNKKSKIGEDENTNHVNHVNARNSSLQSTHNAAPRLLGIRTTLNNRTELLKNTNNKKNNSRVLYLRTKIFDSDTESDS